MQNSKNNILFPGGLKPFHDGHLLILYSYVKNGKCPVNEIQIIISKKDRCGITADSTSAFLEIIKKNIEILLDAEIKIIVSEDYSPIRTCYRIVGNGQENELFCMAASDKDNDARLNNFINDWSIGGKYYKGYNTLFSVDTDITPALYDRKDEFNNCPVSSSVVRNDIINNDFENFLSSYKFMLEKNILTTDILSDYFNKLKSLLKNDENNSKKLNLIKKNNNKY